MDIQQDGKMERPFQYPDVVPSTNSMILGGNIEVAMNMVLETLQQASSQNAEILKPAEKKLLEWEKEPGYYSILLNIFTNHSLDVTVRWLGVLTFKTGVDRYWRNNAPNAISAGEKEFLRTGLLTNFHEPVVQVASQLAVVIAKVARLDWPREWPTLMPVLLEKVQDSDILIQQRALLTLHYVIKTLSSKRLIGDRRLFHEFSADVYSFVLNLWNTHTEDFLHKVTSDSSNALPALEKSLLALRILRRLTVHGFKVPHESRDVVIFIKMVFERAKTMLECRNCMLDKRGMVEILEKFIIQLTKVLLSLLEVHPLSFVDFIEPSLQFALFYAFSPEGQPFLFERFVVQSLNLIKLILLCAEYRQWNGDEGSFRAESAKATRVKETVFQPDTVAALCHRLVGHYFLLTPENLQLWDSDPESFASDEGGECWKYSLKPCSESLFVTLLDSFRSSEILLELIRNNQELVSPSDLNAILMKDAIYNAAGLAVSHLYDDVDFDQWFMTSLSAELRVDYGHYRVIRRRIAWLLAQWTQHTLSSHLSLQLYQVMLHLLRPEEDLVVRLSASNALRSIVDDVEFNVDQFLDYLESTVAHLFSLLKKCEECETKMHVLDVMSIVVERIGPQVKPYLSSLVQYLPFVWEESAEHMMLRCAIISTTTQIVKAMYSECTTLESFILPVIALSTDRDQHCSVYLLEDGLALWLAYVQNCAEMSDGLVEIYRNMPALFELTEHIKMCTHITYAYLLLAPEDFLKTYGQALVSKCEYLLTDLRDEGIIEVMVVYEMILGAAPEIAIGILRQALPNIFSFIYKCEPSRVHGAIPTLVVCSYLSIMARILLFSRDTFAENITALARKLNVTEDEVLGKILDTSVEKLPCGSDDGRRKLLSLALASLLTVQSRTVFQRLPSILKYITETLNDIVKVEPNGTLTDLLVPEPGSPVRTGSPNADSDEEEDNDSEPEAEHSERELRLQRSDIVHTVKLSSCVQSQFAELLNQAGAQQMEEMMRTVDRNTLCQLKEYGIV